MATDKGLEDVAEGKLQSIATGLLALLSVARSLGVAAIGQVGLGPRTGRGPILWRRETLLTLSPNNRTDRVKLR